MEVNYDWIEPLKRLKELYPYSLIKPLRGNFGVAIFSKYRFEEIELQYFIQDVPSIYVKIYLNEKQVNIIATHPFPPINKNIALLRDTQLDNITLFIDNLKNLNLNSIIVMGDLNITPFSRVFKDFVKRSDLKDSSFGFGVKTTFRRGTIFAIPIDFILISKDIFVKTKDVKESFGSDHNLISATLLI